MEEQLNSMTHEQVIKVYINLVGYHPTTEDLDTKEDVIEVLLIYYGEGNKLNLNIQ